MTRAVVYSVMNASPIATPTPAKRAGLISSGVWRIEKSK